MRTVSGSLPSSSWSFSTSFKSMPQGRREHFIRKLALKIVTIPKYYSYYGAKTRGLDCSMFQKVLPGYLCASRMFLLGYLCAFRMAVLAYLFVQSKGYILAHFRDVLRLSHSKVSIWGSVIRDRRKEI